AKMKAGEGRDRDLAVGEAAREANATLASLSRLWPLAIIPITAAGANPLALARPVETDGRIPIRNPAIQGPLNVYYYDYFTEVLGTDVARSKLSKRDGGEILAYECFNLVDGRTGVSEIRDILAGRYTPVPLAEISEYMDL